VLIGMPGAERLWGPMPKIQGVVRNQSGAKV
jgi:hypothetical protein